MELRNTDGVFKYTLSRPAVLRGKYKGEYAMNTIALKADNVNKRYKLFANGELIAKLDTQNFKFVNDITGVDNIALGGTIRNDSVSYPFGGTIHNMRVYSNILTDKELISKTSITTYGSNIFLFR